jgi:CheY-like chemotaxis protein
MHTINVLIGNSNPRVTNLIFSLVRSVCGDSVGVDCTRAMRVDEVLAQAVRNNFDLIIVNPEDLCAAPERRRSTITIRQAIDAIRSIKTLRSAPVICVAVSPENELLLSQAGANQVLGLPFNCEELKEAVGRFVVFPEPELEARQTRQSFASAFLRGWEKFAAALSL